MISGSYPGSIRMDSDTLIVDTHTSGNCGRVVCFLKRVYRDVCKSAYLRELILKCSGNLSS